MNSNDLSACASFESINNRSELLNEETQTPDGAVKKETTRRSALVINAGDFESEKHFYPRVLNAQIHPLVASFCALGNERIIARYTHLYPQVKEEALREILSYKPQYFAWAGCDLFNVTDAHGNRNMIVIETNSCPSGQKSMPLLQDHEEYGGYGIVLDHTFKNLLQQTDPTVGGLAVVYDKNEMEASGYAAVMADLMKERVFMAEYQIYDKDPPVKWEDRLMYVRDKDDVWHPIRACFRYVTQKPWNRFPVNSKTLVLNSVLSCLAGGRNKMMAARAYEFYNAELATNQTGLEIRIPETIRNVTKNEIPLWYETMGGHVVIKVPYSNAGQGVYTITCKEELDEFMAIPHHYNKFIVQSLVGNASWSSQTRQGTFFHVGTIPNRKNHIFVSDLRMMVSGNTAEGGFRPVAIYARRARKPLLKFLDDDRSITSWEMLGTNLSVKTETEGTPQWSTETQRLLLMDRKDFNSLGLGVDDMIDAYVQTVLSVIAIDKMCQKLMPEKLVTNEVYRELRSESDEIDAIKKFYASEPATYDPKSKPNIEIVKQEERDGKVFVREQIRRVERKFDLSLFEALNPDKKLLQEIFY